MTEAGDFIRTVGGVEVFQWNPFRDADDHSTRPLGNFGDLLGPLVVERMLWRRSPLRVEAESAGSSRLLTVGSVLHLARRGDVVWGSGVNGKTLRERLSDWPELDVRAVRGPWTARLLSHAGLRVPAVFGDPALLLGRLVPELGKWARRKVHDTLVVPNFNDSAQHEGVDVELLAPTESMWTVLRAVAQSRLVVGSSLHAIAVADGLGVPARFVVSESEDPFKYRDYLAGTGRPTTRIAESISDALALGPQRSPDVDFDALEQAFPWDLWGFDEEQTQVTDEFVPDAMQDAWLERIKRGGSDEQARHFVGELMPRLRQAAVENAPDLDSIIEEAITYRREVAPEVTPDEVDADSLRILSALETRDKTVVRTAACLGDSPSLAFLRCVHVAGRYLGIALVLHHMPSLAPATSVELVLKALSSGRVVRLPVILFGIQREQWHVDVEVLVEMKALTGERKWTLAVEVDGPTPTSVDVLSVPPDSLGLLALERGDLPMSAPLATVSANGADALEPSSNPRTDVVPEDV